MTKARSPERGSRTKRPSLEVKTWGWDKWPPVQSMWAEVSHSDWAGYMFRLVFLGSDLSSIETRRVDDSAAPLRAHLLQRVPLGALERAARQHVDNWMADWAEAVSSSSAPMNPALEKWSKTFADLKPEDMDRDRQLAKWAKKYVETLGHDGQTQILAEAFHYTESSVSRKIREARVHGLLTPTTKGRPGGSLTPKAVALLQEEAKVAKRPRPNTKRKGE